MSAIPRYANKVIVPIANPATAPNLLNLGLAVVNPEEGKVIAVTVVMGDSEKENKSLKDLKPIIDALKEEGEPVELMTVRAPSAARGILDAVRDRGGDLLIIGVQKPIHGEVVMGSVAENVAETAPCDVLIYRAAQKQNYKRVAFWANGSEASRVASTVGILLAQQDELPLEAMVVQNNTRSRWQALARIEQSLADIPGRQSVKRTVIEANSLLGGLLSRITSDDLFVVGFSRRSELEKWLYGDFAQELLNRAPGPVVLTSRASGKDLRPDRVLRQRIRQFTPTLTRSEQDDVVRSADDMSLSSLDYLVLIIISATLATFGLLLNSAAVIIGAMLVAPLMQPLVAVSVGLTIGRLRLLRQSLLTVAIGIGAVLGVSITLGLLIPTSTPTTEMLSRGTPTLLDVGVALASGLIAAYATARKDIPAALAGVAIAAALVPPLCTTGLAIAFGERDLALGSGLLFLMNISYIAFSGWIVFLWLGMRPREGGAHLRPVVLAIIALVVFLALAIIGRNLGEDALNTSQIESELDDAFAPGEVTAVEIFDEDPMRIVATLRADEPPTPLQITEAEAALEDVLDESLQLEVVYLQVISIGDGE